MFDLVHNIENCYYNIPHIIYYSHIGTAIASLIVGFFVYTNNRHSLQSKLLFFLTINFSIWVILDLVTWISYNSSHIMFAWSTLIAVDLMMYIISFYLLYTFLFKRDLNFYFKLILFLIVLPTVVLAPTTLNVLYFDAVSCNAIDGFISETYLYGTEAIVYLAMLITTLIYFVRRPKDGTNIKQATLFSSSLLLFLGIFLSTNTLASYYDTNEFLWSLTQYGLFGMVLFMAALSYLIVKFQTFNIKLVGAQALVFGIVVIIGSQVLFVESNINIILVSTTFVLSCIGGFLLVQTVKREIQQREELQILTGKLEKANKRLKVLDQMKSEFVSIASHQLRSPLTSIRGYSSMLLEGSYGNLSEKATDAVERIAESSRMMALSVEDYLNVSRIQAGNMKYELSDFNLTDTASHIVDDVRRDAIKKGLVLSYKSDMKAKGIVHADKGKVMQILHNLINNAVKYTPKGAVTVFAHDKGKEIYIDVIDSGIGMSSETIENIFAKFERAKNANEVNVTGTGLGLYVAQKMAEEMSGSIKAFSDGEDKGSTFRLTLPLHM